MLSTVLIVLSLVMVNDMIYLMGESNPRSKSYEPFSLEKGVKDGDTYVINDDPAKAGDTNKLVKAIAVLVSDVTVVSFYKDDDLFRIAIDAGVPVIMDEQHQEIDREYKRDSQIAHDTMAYELSHEDGFIKAMEDEVKGSSDSNS